MNSTILRPLALSLFLPLAACGGDDPCADYTGTGNCVAVSVDRNDPTTSIKTALLSAQPGDVIQLPEGRFELATELSVSKDDITIRGAGRDKTILDFSGQAAGAGSAGIKAESVKNFTVEALSVVNTSGDAIVAINSVNVTFQNLRVEWERGPDPDNGLYGLYPVRSRNVLVKDNLIRGASDAGIYVGESTNAVVVGNNAWENVSGLQIENTVNSEVYNNTVTNNTLGLFIFDLPNKLHNKNGGHHLVYDNVSRNNNLGNYADASQISGDAPAGTGILVMATRNVEVRNNTVEDNSGIGIGVASYFSTLRPISDDQYYPYPISVYIHDNTIIGGGDNPNIKRLDGGFQDIGLALVALFGDDDVADLVFDGVVTDTVFAGGTTENPQAICFKDNTADGNPATFANLNFEQLGVEDPELTFDELLDNLDSSIIKTYENTSNPFACEGKIVSGVTFTDE
ncbi:MAG: DUF1565 domain-containing protein [Candidatus Dadabacteria bacterium]|nr:MAG: DUF1565 domain-containing protein [Candidatus Dadabacteria bacterium]